MSTTPKIVKFESLKVRRNFDLVSAEIKKLIFDGTLKPGDKLPSETKLAQQFNVGRQTIREALRILELSGFINVKRGSDGGSIISQTVSSKIQNLLVEAIKINAVSLDELTIARLEIEKLVLNYVIKYSSDTDIDLLKANIINAKEKLNNNVRAISENIEFHLLLAKAANNQIFFIVTETIMAIVADFISRKKPSLKTSKAVVAEHEAILDSIINKNISQAEILLEKHILDVAHRFKKHFKV